MAEQAAPLSIASQPGPLVAGRKPAAKQARAAPRATVTAERTDSAFDEEALLPLEVMGPISDAQSCRSSALVRGPSVPPGFSCITAESHVHQHRARRLSSKLTSGSAVRKQGLPYRAINKGPPKPPCNQQRVKRLRELDVMDKPPDPEIGAPLSCCCVPLGLA